MSFKKLHPHLLEQLEQKKIEVPTPFQQKSIPVIKSGKNAYCIAPHNSGKTTTLVLTTLQKIGCEAFGNAPRAVVVTENKERVLELYELFLEYTKQTTVRVYASYKELHIDIQKSEIFEGIDILITTPKTLHKLFLTNGVSTSDLKIFSVDNCRFLAQKSDYAAMLAITQSIIKCQYVLYTDVLPPILHRFEEHFMERAVSIEQK